MARFERRAFVLRAANDGVPQKRHLNARECVYDKSMAQQPNVDTHSLNHKKQINLLNFYNANL